MKPTRIFSFGCSMTGYYWPTWADIIAYELNYDAYENWGFSGAGNVAIYNRIVEADARHAFNSNDLILIMWSSIMREDRIGKCGWWSHAGNIYTQNHYDRSFIRKYWSETDAIVKSFNCMISVPRYLGSVPSLIGAMCDISDIDGYGNPMSEDSDHKLAVDVYRKRLATAMDSTDMKSHLGGWKSQKYWGKEADYHPLPMDHLDYVEACMMPKLGSTISDRTREWVVQWNEIALNASSVKVMNNLWREHHSYREGRFY